MRAMVDGRFRVACALAAYAPDDPRWEQFNREVAAKLVTEDALALSHWKFRRTIRRNSRGDFSFAKAISRFRRASRR